VQVESTHELHLEGHKLLPTNPHLAFQCFAGAAARGHGPSHAQLAHMHLNGHSAADKNVARAHELAARGAALGCSDSKGVLGWLTYKGRGVFRNKQTGEQLMRESADAGSAWGQWALGLMYFQRQSRMPAEIHLEGHCREETVRYFRMAAERGHSDAQFYLGRVLEGRVDEHFKVGWGRDINEAARFYLMAAQQGHSAAQTKLGKMFEWKGQYHMNEAVLGEIVRYFRWGAERGHSAAQVYFGFLLRDGRGVAQDSAEAERYFIMAAEQGNSEAMFQLGEMYHKKWEKNDPTGSNWYRLGKRYYSAAEEHGHWAVGWPPDRWR
jgi:TPR repeat protein